MPKHVSNCVCEGGLGEGAPRKNILFVVAVRVVEVVVREEVVMVGLVEFFCFDLPCFISLLLPRQSLIWRRRRKRSRSARAGQRISREPHCPQEGTHT